MRHCMDLKESLVIEQEHALEEAEHGLAVLHLRTFVDYLSTHGIESCGSWCKF